MRIGMALVVSGVAVILVQVVLSLMGSEFAVRGIWWTRTVAICLLFGGYTLLAGWNRWRLDDDEMVKRVLG
jgi:hypothetical protein